MRARVCRGHTYEKAKKQTEPKDEKLHENATSRSVYGSRRAETDARTTTWIVCRLVTQRALDFLAQSHRRAIFALSYRTAP